MIQPVYGQLQKRSECQHLFEAGVTLCGREIAPHRMDKWDVNKGRGQYFPDRRVCFNCNNVLFRRLAPADTMKMAESLFLNRKVDLRLVS